MTLLSATFLKWNKSLTQIKRNLRGDCRCFQERFAGSFFLRNNNFKFSSWRERNECLLVEMFLRLLLSATLLSLKLFHHGVSSSDTMYKKALNNSDALCNDGSSAVYFLGVQNTSKWIIFLESGAYCLTKADCLARFGNEYTKVLMTSQQMPDTIEGRDLLSSSPSENGLFDDFSRVLIPYCSSDAFLGTETKASSFENIRSVDDFIFSGQIIFQSVIFALLLQGLNHARELVLIGSSAGAVGAYNQVKWLQDLLSSRNLDVNLSVIIDGGWFINFQESIASKVAKEFYQGGKPLPRACADSTYGYPCCLSASCMLTRGYYPSNVPTIFVFSMYDIYIIGDSVERTYKRVNVAANGVTALITLVDLYGGAMNQSLVAIRPNSSNFSYFVPACFQHTFFSMSSLRDQGGVLHYSRMFTQGNTLFGMNKRPRTWLSAAIRRGNETITLHSTLHKWTKTRDRPVRVTDSCLGAMCNPTCPEILKFVDTATDWGEVLNGVVFCMSLGFTVACVLLKFCFVCQLVLLKRSRRHYHEKHIKQKSVYELGEGLTLLYSSLKDSNHPQSYSNVQETVEDNVKQDSRKNEDQLSDDYTAKGYNTIFYRTVQYLRMVFRQKHHNTAHTKQGIDQDTQDKRKAICARGIHNVTLSFKQGEFIAIIGKQRAGKTTLLKILSGRSMCRCNEEHMFVNGIKASYAAKTGFLSKFALPYYGEITVRYYLLLVAFMRMPRSTNNTAKLERVEQIISEMNLISLADKTFGASWENDFTELQKRLLCLALQVITRPIAIFLDEPITGLDSVSSMEMLDVLRRLCDNGHLVIITTQALPEKTAELFNQLVLFSDKQVLYNGEPSRLSECYSVTDENEKRPGLEGIISDILENKGLKEAMIGQKQFEPVVKDTVHSNTREKHILPRSHNSLDHGGLLTRLFVIDYRASLSSSLAQTVYLPIMFSVFGLTAGIVYWQAETHLQIITAFCGASIPSLLFLSSVLLNRIKRSLEICRMESSLHVGYAHEHVIHTFLSTSAACLLPVIAISVQTYFMVMTSYNWRRFVLVTVISLVLNQTWIAVYMMVAYTTPSNACHAGFMVAIVAGFSGGFIVPRDQMPIVYNLLFYINPQFYGYSAITKVLLKDFHLKCEYESKLSCISTDGNAVLATFDFDSVNPYGNLVVMLCFTVLSLLFSWILCDARTSR